MGKSCPQRCMSECSVWAYFPSSYDDGKDDALWFNVWWHFHIAYARLWPTIIQHSGNCHARIVCGPRSNKRASYIPSSSPLSDTNLWWGCASLAHVAVAITAPKILWILSSAMIVYYPILWYRISWHGCHSSSRCDWHHEWRSRHCVFMRWLRTRVYQRETHKLREKTPRPPPTVGVSRQHNLVTRSRKFADGRT